MKNTNTLYKKVLMLVFDILSDTIKVGKQINLPNRKRKGNLLSSLFIFFIGIIERLNFFEHGIFSMAALFRKKYVKQTIFVIGFNLFLLSLFEWTGDPRISNNIASTSTEQLSPGFERKILIAKQEQVVCASDKTSTHYQRSAYNTTYYTYSPYTAHLKKFLLNGSLRI